MHPCVMGGHMQKEGGGERKQERMCVFILELSVLIH